jgi:tyrosyl-tRNA synthetase
VGTDGRLRMSKSTGNYIGINEPPKQQYGKVMSIPDEAMLSYYKLVTRFSPAQIAQVEADMKSGRLHPRDAKMLLAREIVSIFHGEPAAATAEEHFKTVFQQRELPPDMPEHPLSGSINVVDLMLGAGLVGSKREARRLIEQQGVKLDGEIVESVDTMIQPRQAQVLQVGRRKFLRLTAG